MKNFQNILVIHAAAIGDAVLATPVSVKLKFALPSAKITYLTHPSLFPLLELCTAIDAFHPYDKKESIFAVRRRISSLKPDLIVDLSGSIRTFFRTVLLSNSVLHYKKQGEKSHHVVHAVDNFLHTIAQLELPDAPSIFPSLHPQKQHFQLLARNLAVPDRPHIALVPGVGTLRPHRAWNESNWIALAKEILIDGRYDIVLIGGPEEHALCDRIACAIDQRCVNAAGKISLPETAALLSNCVATVSGDTGPAHISVSVGTPVIGIYGPTLPERSGPYGSNNTVISNCEKCQCRLTKFCTVTGPGEPGECLKEVSVRPVRDSLFKLI